MKLTALLVCAWMLFTMNTFSNENWTVVLDEDFKNHETLRRWHADKGEWALTPEGLQRRDSGREGMLRLQLPVVAGAVRVEYEAKSDNPADLSLLLGMKGSGKGSVLNGA